MDELILNPNLKLEDLIHQLFKHNPLAFSLFDDVQVEKFYDTVRQHFYNIKTLIDSRFNVEEIQLKDCLLEPSFYSVQYGIQGRLDVLYENSEKAFYWILELKVANPIYQTNMELIQIIMHKSCCIIY